MNDRLMSWRILTVGFLTTMGAVSFHGVRAQASQRCAEGDPLCDDTVRSSHHRGDYKKECEFALQKGKRRPYSEWSMAQRSSCAWVYRRGALSRDDSRSEYSGYVLDWFESRVCRSGQELADSFESKMAWSHVRDQSVRLDAGLVERCSLSQMQAKHWIEAGLYSGKVSTEDEATGLIRILDQLGASDWKHSLLGVAAASDLSRALRVIGTVPGTQRLKMRLLVLMEYKKIELTDGVKPSQKKCKAFESWQTRTQKILKDSSSAPGKFLNLESMLEDVLEMVSESGAVICESREK